MSHADARNFKMAVGDVDSKEMGTGARANSDKPKWELMPLTQISYIVDRESYIRNLYLYYRDHQTDNISSALRNELPDNVNAFMFGSLGYFQSGDIRAKDLLLAACVYHWYYSLAENLMHSLESVISVWDYGLKKYAEFNWATGMDWSIPIACISRHVKYHIEGELMDDESGELHSAHVVCNAMMLVHYEQYWKEGDNRPLFAFPKQTS